MDRDDINQEAENAIILYIYEFGKKGATFREWWRSWRPSPEAKKATREGGHYKSYPFNVWHRLLEAGHILPTAGKLRERSQVFTLADEHRENLDATQPRSLADLDRALKASGVIQMKKKGG